MPPTPIPSPVDVILHSNPAEWWQVLGALGPLAVLLSAIVAGLIGWNTLKQRTAADALALAQKREADAKALDQKTKADSRAEWWRRAQWALDSSLSDDPDRAKLGLGIMAVLASNPPGPDEVRIITIAWEDPLQVAEGDVAEDEPDDDDNGPEGVYVGTLLPPPVPDADSLSGAPDRQRGVDDEPKPGDNESTTEEKE